MRWLELATKKYTQSSLNQKYLWRQRLSIWGRPAPNAEGTSFGRASDPPGAAPQQGLLERGSAGGNKVACSALEVLKMQMYRNFRPSPSLLLARRKAA